MRIGEVATAASVPPKTIRFWESLGLLPAPRRTPAGYRDYTPDIVGRLAFIRRAQGAGFRLDQINEILAVTDSGHPPCAHVQELIASRLADIDARIAELTRAREHLLTLAQRAAAQDPDDCHGYCVILTA